MSDSSGGWFLTHGDGDVHGPYTLAALVQAARLGNVTDTTQVRHATHTKDEWLRAVRMRPIADAMDRTTPPPDSSPEPKTARSAASGKAPTPAGKVAPAGEPVPASEPVADADVGVAVRTPRRHGRGKSVPIVPESFGGAVAALFDFRFRYFVTPWIVSITWATCVVLAAFAFVIFTYGFLVQPISGASSANRGAESIESTVLGGGAVTRAPGWEFQPPAAFHGQLGRVIAYGGVVLLAGFVLLYLRVLFEGAIVVFRIATDLQDVRELLKEK